MRNQLIDEVAKRIDVQGNDSRMDMAEAAVDKYIDKIANQIYIQMWKDRADTSDR